MNSPADAHPSASNLPERAARLEVTCERILEELRELRAEMRDMRAESRGETQELRRTVSADFRILFGALIAVAVGLAGTMARAFGWL